MQIAMLVILSLILAVATAGLLMLILFLSTVDDMRDDDEETPAVLGYMDAQRARTTVRVQADAAQREAYNKWELAYLEHLCSLHPQPGAKLERRKRE